MAVASAVRPVDQAPPLRSAAYQVALLIPVFLLLQRQSWALPKTGLGVGLGVLLGVVVVLVSIVLTAGGAFRPARHGGPVPYLVGLWLAIAFMTFGLSSMIGNNPVPNSAALAMGQQVVETLFVFALAAALSTPQRILTFVKVLVACGAAYGLLLIVTSLVGHEVADSLRLPILTVGNTLTGVEQSRAGLIRPQGFAGHPLEAGSVAAILTPLALAVFGQARTRASRLRWGLATALLALGAASTLARSATISLVVALVLMSLRWSASTIVKVWGSIVAAVLVLALAMPSRFDAYVGLFSLNSSTDTSLLSRETARNSAFDVIGRYPISGQGTGSMVALHQPILDNQYLSFAVEQGLPYAVIFLLAFVIPALHLLATCRRLPTSLTPLAIALAGSLGAFATVAAILDCYAFPQVRMLSMVFLGLTVAVAAQRLRRPAADAR